MLKTLPRLYDLVFLRSFMVVLSVDWVVVFIFYFPGFDWAG